MQYMITLTGKPVEVTLGTIEDDNIINTLSNYDSFSLNNDQFDTDLDEDVNCFEYSNIINKYGIQLNELSLTVKDEDDNIVFETNDEDYLYEKLYLTDEQWMSPEKISEYQKNNCVGFLGGVTEEEGIWDSFLIEADSFDPKNLAFLTVSYEEMKLFPEHLIVDCLYISKETLHKDVQNELDKTFDIDDLTDWTKDYFEKLRENNVSLKEKFSRSVSEVYGQGESNKVKETAYLFDENYNVIKEASQKPLSFF